MEQLDQSGYELRKLHGSNTNAKYGLKKRPKKIVNGLFGINDLNENANNHFYEKQYGKSDDWSECLLLENQLGVKLS